MINDKDDIIEIKQNHLLNELSQSKSIIISGLRELQLISDENDFYYLPMQMLSSGIERFMKCYICLAYYNKKNRFPDFITLKKYGHDLVTLKDTILKNFYNNQSISVLIEDQAFLNNDEDLKIIIYYLSEFGRYARYYNLDIVTDNQKPGIDINREWQKYEIQIINKDEQMKEKILKNDLFEDFYEYINNFIITIIERFISALSRQFTIGKLGDLALQYSHIFRDFYILSDEDYGKRDYRSYLKTKVETYPLVSRKEFEDKYNDIIIEKITITKSVISDIEKWPYYNNEVEVLTIQGKCDVVIIDDFVFSLNGLAKTRFKIPTDHEGNKAKIGFCLDPSLYRD